MKKIYNYITDTKKYLYFKVKSFCTHVYSTYILCTISFFESIFFPIPTDVLMIPMIIYQRKKLFKIINLTILFSILGAAAGYYIGYYISINTVSIIPDTPIYQNVTQLFHKHGNLVMIIGAITPLPFKITVLMAGYLQMNFVTFLIFSLIGRSIRYYSFALFIYLFGDKIINLFENKKFKIYSNILFILFFVTTATYIYIKYL